MASGKAIVAFMLVGACSAVACGESLDEESGDDGEAGVSTSGGTSAGAPDGGSSTLGGSGGANSGGSSPTGGSSDAGADNGGASGSATGGSSSGDGGLGGTAAGAGGQSGGAGSSGEAGRNGGAGAGAGAAGRAGAGGGSCRTDDDCQGFKCCNGSCKDYSNDFQNCGSCGHECPSSTPYCGGAQCVARPCTTTCSDAASCCGSMCCGAGQICCERTLGCCTIPTCVNPTAEGICPRSCLECGCADPMTPIATPSGNRPIATLRVGDLVYSVDHGTVRAVPIMELRRTEVSAEHRMTEVLLSSGVLLRISPSHPTADGRNFAALRHGDELDGSLVEAVEDVAYGERFTYDILPDSDSATYFAGGVLIGSTLGSPWAGSATSVAPEAPLSRADGR